MAVEKIVIFHHDERGAVRTWSEVGELVRCKDCIFGYKYFDIINGITDSWIECRNPDGLNRDVSCDGYCSAGIKYEGEIGR